LSESANTAVLETEQTSDLSLDDILNVIEASIEPDQETLEKIAFGALASHP
jgi:hypothetical protein